MNIELSAGAKNLKLVVAHVDKYLQLKKEDCKINEEIIDNPDWAKFLQGDGILTELKKRV